jgi:hypothetical protein
MVENLTHIHVTLTIPSTKPEVKMICVSDTHDFQDGMPHDLPKADIMVHAGDFTV